MARTIAEINTSMNANITQAITNPSGSMFAEWRLWRSIFAAAIWAFENILDAFKVEIETKVQTKQPGTFSWYYDRILEFQGGDESGTFQGDNLTIEDGIIKYLNVDETRRIITQASLREGTNTINVKVAKKLTETTAQALTSAEQLALELYINNIKYPGTSITIISMSADIIRFTIQIVYDPVLSTATVGANIAEKLEEYRQSLGFDDRVYKQTVIDNIMKAEGVISVKLTSMEGWGVSTNVYTAIDIVRTLEAGYFNFGALTYTYTNYKTLQ